MGKVLSIKEQMDYEWQGKLYSERKSLGRSQGLDVSKGGVYPTSISGDVEVLGFTQARNREYAVVKFLDTGNTRLTLCSSITRKNVKDFKLEKQQGSISRGSPVYKVGSVHQTTNSGDIVITDYKSCFDIEVEFLDSGYRRRVTSKAIYEGLIKDPNLRSIMGVGYVGEGSPKRFVKKGDIYVATKCYHTWYRMIGRCYNESRLEHAPCYRDVGVCDEWKCFKTFSDWWEKHEYKQDDWQLDKDVLDMESRVYSPETCTYLPGEINLFFVKRKKRDDGTMRGAYLGKDGKWYARQATEGMYDHGPFSSYEEALEEYFSIKQKRALHLAEKYKGMIDSRVEEKLRNFKLEYLITSEH